MYHGQICLSPTGPCTAKLWVARAICRSHLATRRSYLCSTAAGPKDFRQHCNKTKHHQIYVLSLEGAVACAVVRNPIACVLLHLSLAKYQQEWSQWVHSGAVWRIRKKTIPQTRCQKLPQRPLRQKRGSPNSRLASVYYIPNNALPWKQCYVTTLLSSINSACAQRSACRPSEVFLYQTCLCW